MSKLSEELRLDVPAIDAMSACRAAIEQLGWKQDGDAGEDRVVAKVGWGLFRNPSKIEMLVGEEGGATVVTLNGSIKQVGPVAKSQLRQKMDELRAAIEAAATHSG